MSNEVTTTSFHRLYNVNSCCYNINWSINIFSIKHVHIIQFPTNLCHWHFISNSLILLTLQCPQTFYHHLKCTLNGHTALNLWLIFAKEQAGLPFKWPYKSIIYIWFGSVCKIKLFYSKITLEIQYIFSWFKPYANPWIYIRGSRIWKQVGPISLLVRHTYMRTWTTDMC